MFDLISPHFCIISFAYEKIRELGFQLLRFGWQQSTPFAGGHILGLDLLAHITHNETAGPVEYQKPYLQFKEIASCFAYLLLINIISLKGNRHYCDDFHTAEKLIFESMTAVQKPIHEWPWEGPEEVHAPKREAMQYCTL